MFTAIVNRLKSNLWKGKEKTNGGAAVSMRVSHYCNFAAREDPLLKKNLFRRISALRDPDQTVAPLLDQWVDEGKTIHPSEARNILGELRRRKQFSHALQVSEWMSSKTLYSLSTRENAVHLNLIGAIHGVDAAETYFNELIDERKDEKTYGALLNCYVREGLVDRSLSHFQKMKEKGFASSPLSYNNLMCLYSQFDQFEKILDLKAEMKRNRVLPDNLSYRIFINSCGQRSDFNGMEKLVREMESLPHSSMDWTTYSMVVNIYIKADLKEKAVFFLKKLEDKVGKDGVGYNHLITLHAQLGNIVQVMRVWGLQKNFCKKQNNRDYIIMLSMLVKLDELEKAEELLKEWESSCHTYDFRVPNILLLAYSRRGMLEKAEETLENIIETGKTPTPNCWAIIALGNLINHNMEKALKCMEEALEVAKQNTGWKPSPRLVSGILQWLGDKGDAEKEEAFVSSLRKVVPEAFIKANVQHGNDSNKMDGTSARMEAYIISEDEEMSVSSQMSRGESLMP